MKEEKESLMKKFQNYDRDFNIMSILKVHSEKRNTRCVYIMSVECAIFCFSPQMTQNHLHNIPFLF